MRRRQDDLLVIIGRCCEERCRQQRDAGSSSDGVGVDLTQLTMVMMRATMQNQTANKDEKDYVWLVVE
jgi:hypothetical protein